MATLAEARQQLIFAKSQISTQKQELSKSQEEINRRLGKLQSQSFLRSGQDINFLVSRQKAGARLGAIGAQIGTEQQEITKYEKEQLEPYESQLVELEAQQAAQEKAQQDFNEAKETYLSGKSPIALTKAQKKIYNEFVKDQPLPVEITITDVPAQRLPGVKVKDVEIIPKKIDTKIFGTDIKDTPLNIPLEIIKNIKEGVKGTAPPEQQEFFKRTQETITKIQEGLEKARVRTTEFVDPSIRDIREAEERYGVESPRAITLRERRKNTPIAFFGSAVAGFATTPITTAQFGIDVVSSPIRTARQTVSSVRALPSQFAKDPFSTTGFIAGQAAGQTLIFRLARSAVRELRKPEPEIFSRGSRAQRIERTTIKDLQNKVEAEIRARGTIASRTQAQNLAKEAILRKLRTEVRKEIKARPVEVISLKGKEVISTKTRFTKPRLVQLEGKLTEGISYYEKLRQPIRVLSVKEAKSALTNEQIIKAIEKKIPETKAEGIVKAQLRVTKLGKQTPITTSEFGRAFAEKSRGQRLQGLSERFKETKTEFLRATEQAEKSSLSVVSPTGKPFVSVGTFGLSQAEKALQAKIISAKSVLSDTSTILTGKQALQNFLEAPLSTKPALVYFPTFQTRQRPVQETILVPPVTKKEEAVVPIVSFIEQPEEATATRPKQRSLQQESSSFQPTVPINIEATSLQLGELLAQPQLQATSLTFASEQGLRQRPRLRFRSQVAQQKKESLKSAMRKIRSWDVYVKRKGKYRKIADNLPRNLAEKTGADYTLRTLAARFKLVPQETSPRIKKDINYEPDSSVFRNFEIRGNNQIPLKDEWIQLAGTRREPTVKGARLRARSEVGELLSFKGSSNLFGLTNRDRRSRRRGGFDFI